MYVAVKGGEAAIRNAHRLLADRRRGDRSVPALGLDQIVEQLALAVDRVMAEGSLYDRELAALAVKQARGDMIEAIFLVRAYRTTLPRFGYTRPVDTAAMLVERRVSATYKDLPGGQLLGPTFDYTHRLLDPGLAEEGVPAEPERREPDEEAMPRVSDLLASEGLIEEDGRVWITVTQKTAATVHEVDASLLEGLWNPPSTPEPIAVLEPGTGDTIAMPALPSLQGGGFSIHMELQAGDIGPGDVLFAARSDAGPRIAIAGTEGGAISVIMSDGEVDLEWTSAPGAIGDAITLTFDGGPNVITLVKDGILCDGGDTHREGWGRFSPELGAVMPRETPARFHPAVTRFSVFDRALRTAEAIALFHGNGVQVVSTGSLSHRDRIARVRSEVTKGLVTYASKAAAPSSFGRNPSE